MYGIDSIIEHLEQPVLLLLLVFVALQLHFILVLQISEQLLAFVNFGFEFILLGHDLILLLNIVLQLLYLDLKSLCWFDQILLLLLDLS